MTRAKAAAEKAARLAAQRHAPVVDPATISEQELQRPARPRPAAPEVQRRPIRLTLDLTPALYDDFEDWRREAARQLGVGRVKSVDVLRILLRKLMSTDDGELSAEVIEALRHEGRR